MISNSLEATKSMENGNPSARIIKNYRKAPSAAERLGRIQAQASTRPLIPADFSCSESESSDSDERDRVKISLPEASKTREIGENVSVQREEIESREEIEISLPSNTREIGENVSEQREEIEIEIEIREEIEIRVLNVEDEVLRANSGSTLGPKPAAPEDIIHILSSESSDEDVQDKVLDGMNKDREEIGPSRRRRQLPASFKGTGQEKEKDEVIVEEEKKGGLMDYVDDLKVIFGNPCGGSDEEEDFFDMVVRKGLMKFDKPRWW